MENFNENLLIEFGNYVLNERFGRILHINEKFIQALISLNPSYFAITDADLCNFKENQKENIL